jgi:hypothetical protein
MHTEGRYPAKLFHCRLANSTMSDPEWQNLFGPIDAKLAEQSPTSPSVIQMASSLVNSAARFATGGLRTVTKEIHDQRLATCQRCEHFSRGSCMICGCYILPKTAMPHEACPLDKWRPA